MLVVAAEDAVEDLSQGADVVQVVQNDHQGAVASRDAAALLGQSRQVLAQLLRRDLKSCKLYYMSHNVWMTQS